MSIPARPDELKNFYRVYEYQGTKMWCVPDAAKFIIDTELERYVRECETCPGWRKGELK